MTRARTAFNLLLLYADYAALLQPAIFASSQPLLSFPVSHNVACPKFCESLTLHNVRKFAQLVAAAMGSVLAVCWSCACYHSLSTVVALGAIHPFATSATAPLRVLRGP